MAMDDVADLLAEMLDGPVESPSAERLWRLSAGNALLLRELVIAAHASGEMIRTVRGMAVDRPARARPQPHRADRRPHRAAQPRRPHRRRARRPRRADRRASCSCEATDADDVERAEDRGLIRVVEDDRRANVRLAHPLYGEVVRKRCPVMRTRRLKAQLADLIEKAGARRRDDLLRVAVWRLDSGTAQDPALLLGAGAQAFARFDVPLAARLARAALDAGGGFDAAELLATIMMFGDQPDEALAVLDSVADQATSDARRARWLTVRGMVSYWGLSRESTVDELAADAKAIADPAHQARVRAFEAIMRLHRLDSANALRIARSILDRPAAPVAARALAQCTIAHLQAAQGELRSADRAIASVAGRRAAVAARHALPAARPGAGPRHPAGARRRPGRHRRDRRRRVRRPCRRRRLPARLRLPVDPARAGGPAARPHQRGAAHQPAGLRGAGDQPDLRRASRTPSGPRRAALRGEADEAAAGDGRLRRAPTRPTWRSSTRGGSRPAAAVLAAGADDGRPRSRRCDLLVWRLRGDGFAGHELLALHDLVRLGQATMPIGWPDGGSPGQTVADRLAELAEAGRRPAAADHGAGTPGRPPRGAGADLLLAADAYAALEPDRLRRRGRRGGGGPAARGHARRSTARPPAGWASCWNGATTYARPALGAGRTVLTDRERQIAKLAANGVPSREIADQLYLSTRTVENHLQRVYTKLGVTGRAGAGPPPLRARCRELLGCDG